jgi:hypothetical protein
MGQVFERVLQAAAEGPEPYCQSLRFIPFDFHRSRLTFCWVSLVSRSFLNHTLPSVQCSPALECARCAGVQQRVRPARSGACRAASNLSPGASNGPVSVPMQATPLYVPMQATPLSVPSPLPSAARPRCAVCGSLGSDLLCCCYVEGCAPLRLSLPVLRARVACMLVYHVFLHAPCIPHTVCVACSCMVYGSVCGKLAFRNLPLLVNECQVCSVCSRRSVCGVWAEGAVSPSPLPRPLLVGPASSCLVCGVLRGVCWMELGRGGVGAPLPFSLPRWVAATRSCGRRRWRSMAFSREKRDCRVLLPCRSKPPTAAVEQLGIATGRGGECIGSSKESFASTVSTAWTAPTSPNRSAHCAGGEGYVCGTALALAHCIPELALTHASLFSRMAALACLDSRAGMSPHALVSTRS